MPTDAPPTPEDSARPGIDPALRRAPFPYMRWAKAHLPNSGPLSLGLSGVHGPHAAAPAGLLPTEIGVAGPALKAVSAAA